MAIVVDHIEMQRMRRAQRDKSWRRQARRLRQLRRAASAAGAAEWVDHPQRAPSSKKWCALLRFGARPALALARRGVSAHHPRAMMRSMMRNAEAAIGAAQMSHDVPKCPNFWGVVEGQ